MAQPNVTALRFRLNDNEGSDNWTEVNEHQGLPMMLVGPDGQRLVLINGAMPVVSDLPFNITGQTTNVVKVGKGRLGKITFNKPLATSVVTITDGILVAGVVTGVVIGTITIPASPMFTTFVYDCEFQLGLIVAQATASSDLTVTFR